MNRCDSSELSDLILSIGTSRMVPAILSFLSNICGAEHCATFIVGKNNLIHRSAASWDGTDTAHKRASLFAAQYWRDDPVFAAIRKGGCRTDIIRTDMRRLPMSQLREKIYFDISERVLVHRRSSSGSAIALTVLRSKNASSFSDDDVSRLQEVSSTLLAVLEKHHDFCEARQNASNALASLGDIEQCILASHLVPRREAEVCARTIYGLSARGIALSLGIGEESVKTYRRRTYERLGVGSPRELLIWYLARWGNPAI